MFKYLFYIFKYIYYINFDKCKKYITQFWIKLVNAILTNEIKLFQHVSTEICQQYEMLLVDNNKHDIL